MQTLVVCFLECPDSKNKCLQANKKKMKKENIQNKKETAEKKKSKKKVEEDISSSTAIIILFLTKRCSLTKSRIQNLLTDTKVLGCNLQKLVRINEIQSLFKA